MTTIVIMPGGFHPFHAGHAALYQSARRAFPDAEVFVAATNDTSNRPFPFAIKEKLARLAGVEPGHFVQVKSPFRAEEITAQFDPAVDTLIFVRSEKDSTKPPQPGGVKKDGSPAYLQPLLGAKKLEPFAKHAYMAYLPTVEFGPGMTSATEIRTAWPELDERRKTALVMSLYPKTQNNPQLAATVVKMLDTAIAGNVSENQGWAATLEANTAGPVTANTAGAGSGMTAGYQQRENQPVSERKEKTAQARDAELIRALQYIKQHYPSYANDTDLAMVKWIQRSLQHSKQNDERQDAEIKTLDGKLDKIQSAITNENTVLVNDPERGIEIRPSGGLGTWTEQTLVSSVAREFADIVNMLRGGSYTNVEHALYRGGTMRAKIEALAKLERFREQQGRRPIARGREIDLGEDYVEERWSDSYKKSINCNNPKGFSQRAHCAGRKK